MAWKPVYVSVPDFAFYVALNPGVLILVFVLDVSNVKEVVPNIMLELNSL